MVSKIELAAPVEGGLAGIVWFVDDGPEHASARAF